MAPRLSRWIALTCVGAGVVATLTLTTGGTPIVFLNSGYGTWNDGELPMGLRISGLKMALHQVQAELATLDLRAQVVAVSARTDLDPLVLRRVGERVVVDAEASKALAPLWQNLPDRRSDIRSVIVVGEAEASLGSTVARLDSNGVCLTWANASRSRTELVADIRAGAGECLLAEQFGQPGKGVRSWRTNVRWGLSWDRDRRYPYWYRYDVGVREWSSPAWFEMDRRPEFLPSGPGYGWGVVRRLEMACLVGRVEQCESASGVTPEGWPGEVRRYGFDPRILPQSTLPRELARALGPEKFGEIWTANDPISVSFARATGRPMSTWLKDWAQRQVGTIERDNGLSLVGWLGAVIWITLFALLIGQRLKQRAAS